MNDYAAFLASKLAHSSPTGIAGAECHDEHLFAFQRDLVTWALRRGKAALFADTGLGKTRMQLAWADHVQRHTGGRVLILAPLSVARQTAAEGAAIGVAVKRVSDGCECAAPGIYVTNYDRIHRFEPDYVRPMDDFDAVVLDESSIIKHHTAKTLQTLLDRFDRTPFKLCASATPSPNDYTELGTHAEFLGVCTRMEMLAEYFWHDQSPGEDLKKASWRLKKHARKAFWSWVASWAAMLRRPSDLGYDDTGYVLPTMHVYEHRSDADPAKVREAGLLFATPASTLTERRDARRSTLGIRIDECLALVSVCTCDANLDGDLSVSTRSDATGQKHVRGCHRGEQWVIWCELNAEQDALRKELGDQCVSISGAQEPLIKELLHEKWLRGEARILVTKPSIFGFGLNWQHCCHMAFVGVTDSFEAYYQATRRIWRFGQRSECHVHIFYNELEGDVLKNLKRKGEDARRMGDELSAETRAIVLEHVRGLRRETNAYQERPRIMPAWMTRREAEYD